MENKVASFGRATSYGWNGTFKFPLWGKTAIISNSNGMNYAVDRNGRLHYIVIGMVVAFHLVSDYYFLHWAALSFSFSIAPGNLTLDNKTANNISIRWQPIPSLFIRGYVVFYSKAEVGSIVSNVSTGPNSPNIIIRGLQSFTNYSIQVAGFIDIIGLKTEPVYVLTDRGGLSNQHIYLSIYHWDFPAIQTLETARQTVLDFIIAVVCVALR